MDRSEAIKKLEQMRDHFNEEWVDFGGVNKAFDLAIEALMLRDKYVKALERMIEGVKEINKSLDEAAKKSDEKHQLSGETSTCKLKKDHVFLTREGEKVSKEQKSGLDLISRADTIKAICAECEFKFYCSGDCTEVAVVKGMPPCNHTCNKKQVTSKLESAENATSEGEESTMGQPKSKLDCISREQAIDALMAHFIPQTYTGEQVEQAEKLAQKIMNKVPPVTPTVSEDCISRSWMVNALQEVNGESDMPDFWHEGMNDAIEEVKNAPNVTPTERTGEWYGTGDGYADGELVYDTWECSECGYVIEEDDTDLLPKYCQECGAKMKGGTEND